MQFKFVFAEPGNGSSNIIRRLQVNFIYGAPGEVFEQGEEEGYLTPRDSIGYG
jgi:hypothetical protein